MVHGHPRRNVLLDYKHNSLISVCVPINLARPNFFLNARTMPRASPTSRPMVLRALHPLNNPVRPPALYCFRLPRTASGKLPLRPRHCLCSPLLLTLWTMNISHEAPMFRQHLRHLGYLAVLLLRPTSHPTDGILHWTPTPCRILCFWLCISVRFGSYSSYHNLYIWYCIIMRRERFCNS